MEAAHHKWQRTIVRVIWRDKFNDEKIEQTTGMETLEVILRKIRLHAMAAGTEWTTDEYHDKHCTSWFPEDGKRGPDGRPRKSWSDTLTENLQNIERTWTDHEETADDWPMWVDKLCRPVCPENTWNATKV